MTEFDIELVLQASGQIGPKIQERLQEKGMRAFISLHEIWGVLEEEVIEFKDGCIRNDKDYCYKELLDIAVAAVLGMAAINGMSSIEAAFKE